MSLRNVKSVQQAHNHVVIYFTLPSATVWGDTDSVTIPVADAKKLAEMLQAELHHRRPVAGAAT